MTSWLLWHIYTDIGEIIYYTFAGLKIAKFWPVVELVSAQQTSSSSTRDFYSECTQVKIREINENGTTSSYCIHLCNDLETRIRNLVKQNVLHQLAAIPPLSPIFNKGYCNAELRKLHITRSFIRSFIHSFIKSYFKPCFKQSFTFRSTKNTLLLCLKTKFKSTWLKMMMVKQTKKENPGYSLQVGHPYCSIPLFLIRKTHLF